MADKSCDSVPEKTVEQSTITSSKDFYRDSQFANEIGTLLDNYENTTVFSDFQNVNKTLLTDNTIAVNNLFVNKPINFADLYPNLNSRLERIPFITTTEIIDFYTFSYVNQNNFQTYIAESKPETIFTLLDTFFSTKNISETSMGSFCALVPNIFSKLDSLNNIFTDFQSFSDDFSNILQSIQNFSLDGLTTASLLNNLKKQILDLVDKLVRNIKNKLMNYSNSMSSSMNSDYLPNQGSILERTHVLISKNDEFLSEDYIKNLKTKISALISHSAKSFAILDIEEIQFLILRFCTFIGEMENVFDSLLVPLDDTTSSYTSSFELLKTAGNPRTARAIAAGAIRYNPPEMTAAYNRIRSIPSSRQPISGTSSPIAERPRRLVTITPEESSEIASEYTYEKVRSGTGVLLYAPGPQSTQEGVAGWNKVLLTEKIMLLRLAKRWGRQIRINSAWRTFGAPRSWHKSGQAFDLSISPGEHDEFALLAYEEGFGGFGSYPTFIHIDSRSPGLVFRRGTIRSL